MDLAALIIAIMSFILSTTVFIWHLSKYFSKTEIQMVPVDPFKDSFSKEIGKGQLDEFRDLGDPIDQDEFEFLNKRKV